MSDLTLRQLRKRLGLTTNQVAALSGFSVSTVRAVELGRRREPPKLRDQLGAGLVEMAALVRAEQAPRYTFVATAARTAQPSRRVYAAVKER